MKASKTIPVVVVADGDDDVIFVGGTPAIRITKDTVNPTRAKAVKVEIGAEHPDISIAPDNRMKVE